MPRRRSPLAVLALLAAHAALAAPARAQDGVRVAVLAFENGGSYGQDTEGFEGLQAGIPIVLRGELARLGVPVVARGPDAGVHGRTHLDATTAAATGTAAGATHTVLGSFIDFYGKLRINARVVDDASGEIVAVVSNADRTQQDRALIATIIHRDASAIAAALKLPASPLAPRTFSAQAVTLLGRGALAEAAGRTSQAAELYARALAASPDLAEASERARALGR